MFKTRHNKLANSIRKINVRYILLKPYIYLVLRMFKYLLMKKKFFFKLPSTQNACEKQTNFFACCFFFFCKKHKQNAVISVFCKLMHNADILYYTYCSTAVFSILLPFEKYYRITSVFWCHDASMSH